MRGLAREVADGGLAAGETALGRCDWEAARAEFEAALAETPEDGRALDGLSYALFWLGDTEGARRAR